VTVADAVPAARQPLPDRVVAWAFAACIVGSTVAWLSLLAGLTLWVLGAI
jgi:hypothetical protein